MTYLFILNDARYASERNYNGLRLACAPSGTVYPATAEHTPSPMRNTRTTLLPLAASAVGDIEWMLRRFAAGHREIGVCRTCLEARGITPEALIDGTRRSTLDALTQWTEEADKLLVF